MKNFIVVFFLAILTVACRDTNNIQLHQWSKYLPIEISEGQTIVYKYYYHMNDDSDKTRKTNIRYKKYKPNGRLIQIDTYDAAFKEMYSETTLITDSSWISKASSYKSYRMSDTTEYVIINYDIHPKKNHFISLEPNTLNYQYTLNDREYVTDIIQDQIRDTIVDNRNGKILSGKQILNIAYEGSVDTIEYRWSKTIQEGLGVTKQVSYAEDMNYQLELVEIMSESEFNKRANHGMHRVGYIDPYNTLDRDSEFTTCYHITKIYDYYNGSSDGIQIDGGKGRLKALLKQKLDPEKIKGFSGYFTFRFVINCNAEAGRFVTEECGLDYQPTTFTQESRDHLLSILMDIDEWKALELMGEKKDAYNYITFKIKDGEIIDLLP